MEISLDKNVRNEFPEKKIILLDGRVVDCYPRLGVNFEGLTQSENSLQQPLAKISTQSDKEREADKERFIKNAFFFLAHKERILTDSRMFLCPVPIQSGMSISGTSGFENPTLGIYLQWWETCTGAMFTDKKGRRGLLYKLSGSGLSGHNICDVVHEDGTTKNVELHPFKDYRDSFIHINNTYKSAKQKYQAYSLRQVLDILDHEEEGERDYAHTINEQMQVREISALNELLHNLMTRKEELEHRNKELEKALFDERVLHFYDRYKDLEKRIFSEMEQLLQQKRDLKMALRRGDYNIQAYERLINAITKRINEAEQELTKFKEREILKAFPEHSMSFWRIESHTQQLRNRNNTEDQKENL